MTATDGPALQQVVPLVFFNATYNKWVHGCIYRSGISRRNWFSWIIEVINLVVTNLPVQVFIISGLFYR